MKITEKQLQVLYQIAMDSVRQNVVGYFLQPIEQRTKVVNDILNQQSDEIIDVEDDKGFKPCPSEVAGDLKTMHGREPGQISEGDVLKESVGLLRKWHQGAKGPTGQYNLTTNTIAFLEEYDKSVTLKEE